MAKNNTLRTLTDALSKTRTTKSGPLALSEVASKYFASSRASNRVSVGGAADSKLSSMNAKSDAAGLRFGSPSSRATNTGSSSFNWSSLVEQAGSGGLASAFGGAGSLLGGFGSLISGLASVFGVGTKAALPALVQFQLPTVQNQAISVNMKGGSVAAGETRTTAHIQGGIYGSQGKQGNGSVAAPTSQYQKNQIVQTVKQALLNSSSLNDVIAEI